MTELPTDAEAEAAAGMSGIERIVSRVLLLAAGLSLVLMSLLTAADVIGRSFRSPLPAATELTEIMMVIVVFCALPVITRRDNHIVIDILDFIVPAGVRRTEAVVVNLVGAVAMFAVAWRVWLLSARAAQSGDFTPYLQLPLYPVFALIAALSCCVGVAFLINFICAVGGRK